MLMGMQNRDVEAVEYFLLPLPAPVASEFASASSFFLQSSSASTKI